MGAVEAVIATLRALYQPDASPDDVAEAAISHLSPEEQRALARRLCAEYIQLPRQRRQRLAFTPEEFAEAIGATVKAVRQYVANGEVQAVRLGGRLYIPATEADRLFGSKAD